MDESMFVRRICIIAAFIKRGEIKKFLAFICYVSLC